MTEAATFQFPTMIRFGAGVVNELGHHLQEQGLKRPLIVTDPICSQLEFFKKIIKSLNVNALVFDQIHKNPIKQDVEKGAEAYRSGDCDSIIGIGGGAPIDVARAIALRIYHPGDLFDYEDCKNGYTKIIHEIPYFITVPTTSGTGSEVGRSTVISDDKTKEKRILFSPRLMAKIVFADPELTLKLPPEVTAATGIDALTHHIEAYLSKGYHPICDGIALEGIKMIFKFLPAAVEKGDIHSRKEMLMASIMGAIAFQKGLGVIHSTAHPLSTVYDTHHGLANAVMLPYGLEYNYPECAEKFETLARTIGSRDFIQSVKELLKQINLPTKLSTIGGKRDDLEKLTKLALADPCHGCNPKKVTAKDFQSIYQKAL